MQGRSCEPGIAEHPLILREGIGVSSVCTRQHHQTKSGRHGRGDAVLVRNKFERHGLAPVLQRSMDAAHQFLASGHIEMMKDVCYKNEVVTVGKHLSSFGCANLRENVE